MLSRRFAVSLAAILLIVCVSFGATTASAAEDPSAARERLCGSNSDCLTVVVVEEIPIGEADDGASVGNEDPEVVAALAMQDAKDAEQGINKQNKKVKRVPRSFLKIDRLNFKTDTVVKLVKNMPDWFGPRPAKFVFRGKEVPINKRLSRYNPRLNEKIIMIAADEKHDEKEIIVTIDSLQQQQVNSKKGDEKKNGGDIKNADL